MIITTEIPRQFGEEVADDPGDFASENARGTMDGALDLPDKQPTISMSMKVKLARRITRLAGITVDS